MARNKDMARCELCGNDYDKSFEIRAGGRTHVFDSFECAIQVIAPECELRLQNYWARGRGKQWQNFLLW